LQLQEAQHVLLARDRLNLLFSPFWLSQVYRILLQQASELKKSKRARFAVNS
jgi:hypothetical protein